MSRTWDVSSWRTEDFNTHIVIFGIALAVGSASWNVSNHGAEKKKTPVDVLAGHILETVGKADISLDRLAVARNALGVLQSSSMREKASELLEAHIIKLEAMGSVTLINSSVEFRSLVYAMITSALFLATVVSVLYKLFNMNIARRLNAAWKVTLFRFVFAWALL